MSTYVLLPGAWLGSFCWTPVVQGLEARGHAALPLTLPGVAERAGEAEDKEIGLDDHVKDVLAELDARDLRDVVLVGHSYAGIVAGMVADQAPDRVRHTVFLDSNLPVHGRSMVDGFSEAGRAYVEGLLRDSGGFWTPPTADDLVENGLQRADAETVVERATPHPGRAITDPASMSRPVSDLRATFVLCTRGGTEVPREVDTGAWSLITIDSDHWPMVSAIPDLVAVLDSIERS